MGRNFYFSVLLGVSILFISINTFAGNSEDYDFKVEENPGDKRKKKDSIPIYPDLVYEYKIAELNNLTPIELEYNDRVRRYIDVYTIERREHLAKIIGFEAESYKCALV